MKKEIFMPSRFTITTWKLQEIKQKFKAAENHHNKHSKTAINNIPTDLFNWAITTNPIVNRH